MREFTIVDLSGQSAVASRRQAASLAALAPRHRALLDRPIVATLAVVAPGGRPSLTPMWFDHEDDRVLINTAAHRRKCAWIRRDPRLTLLLVDPDDPNHWLQFRCTVEKELCEGEPGGEAATRQLDRAWTKYTGKPPPYGDRDPTRDEKRVLFVCAIERIAVFGGA